MVVETQQAVESAGVLGTLGIEGKLFVAQLLNFGIVALVMWKWVYTPLLKVMDERTKKIEQGLKDADASGSARKAAEEASSAVVAEARGKAKQIMDEAVALAASERSVSLERAKAEVAKVVAQGRQEIVAEKEKTMNDIKQEVGLLVAMAAERVLGDKLDEKKDAALIARAIQEVEKSA